MVYTLLPNQPAQILQLVASQLRLFCVSLALLDEFLCDGLEAGRPLEHHQLFLLLLHEGLLQPVLLAPTLERVR